jgi:S1-C subfamily serine protease
MRLRLQVRLAPGSVYTWEHDGPLVRIGRDPRCELPCSGEGCQTVSWEHARLEVRPDGLYVQDMRSSNGTYVNGQVIRQPTRLRAGDQVGLGQTGPRLQVLDLPAPDRPPPDPEANATVRVEGVPPSALALAMKAAPPASKARAAPAALLPPARPAPSVSALQGNGRPVAVPPAGPGPQRGSADSLAAGPGVHPSNTRLILQSLQRRHRRMWVATVAVGVCLLAAVAVGFYLLSEKNADRATELDERASKTDEKARKAEEETRRLMDRIARADEQARKAAAEARQARAEARKAEEEARRARAQTIQGQEIYLRTLRSTAYVTVRFATGLRGTGTGSLIDRKRRLVLTAYHVVDKGVEVGVIFPSYDLAGKVISDRGYYNARMALVLIKARVVASSAQSDLAVIQLEEVPAGVLELPLALGSPSPGSRVHTVGNPGASAGLWAYTVGAVRQVARRRYTFPTKQTVDAFVVETQNPINKGDSGGPVVNDRVELVAVNSGATPNLRDGTLCIDVREVKTLLSGARL